MKKEKEKKVDKFMIGIQDPLASSYVQSTISEKLKSNTHRGWERYRRQTEGL